MAAVENNISDNNNSYIKHSTPPLTYSIRYEFPLLGDDPLSFSRARSDPLACNINNDAVLIWDDRIVQSHEALPDTIVSMCNCKTSIEDVFQELQSTVEAHSKNADSNSDRRLVPYAIVPRKLARDHSICENAVVGRRRRVEQGLGIDSVSNLDCHKTQTMSSIRKTIDDDRSVMSPSGVKNDALEAAVMSEWNAHFNSREIHGDSLYASGFDEIDPKHKGMELFGFARNDSPDVIVIHQNDEGGRLSAVSNHGANFPPPKDPGKTNSMNHAVCDEGYDDVDKSRTDSGHFEDMSVEISSPFQTSQCVNAVYFAQHDDKENHAVYNEQRGARRGSGEEDGFSEDEQYSSRTDINTTDNGNASTSYDVEEYCLEDVFVDVGKEVIGGSVSNDVVLVRSPCLRNSRCGKSRKKSRRRHLEPNKTWRDDALVVVRCANQNCQIASNLTQARKSYKNCHHCLQTYYCSKECRRNDWPIHKDSGVCHGSRVSSACKNVIRYCNTNPEVKTVLSRLAIRGYLAHGRGCVMVGFPDLDSTRDFMEYGFPMLDLDPIYVSVKELSESKMYGSVLESLTDACKTYKPDVKFILNVGVGLRLNKGDGSICSPLQRYKYCLSNGSHEEIDRFGSLGSDLGYGSLSNSINNTSIETMSPISPRNVCHHCHAKRSSFHGLPNSKHKGPILQKFIKLRLSPIHSQHSHEKRWTFEDHFWDRYRTSGPTLILTGIPECSSEKSKSRKRELTFINIQRKLRQRNVNLRHQYPDIYAQLIDYVTKGIHFPSQILFPVDKGSGKTFTCFMMPEAEAELEWMQSHHLLNDLELSKDSLNKSMSRTLSSSMPSLLSRSSQAAKSNTSLSSVDISKVEPESKRTEVLNSPLVSTVHKGEASKPDSKSVRQCNSNLNILPQNVESESKNVSSETTICCDPDTNIRIVNVAGVQEESEKDQNWVGEVTEIKPHIFSENLSKDLLPPIQIQVDEMSPQIFLSEPSINLTTSPSQSGTILNQVDDEKMETSEPIVTNYDATPRYYPVRKARNVRLYSHLTPQSFHTSDSIPRQHQHQQRPQWQHHYQQIQQQQQHQQIQQQQQHQSHQCPPVQCLSPIISTSTPTTTTTVSSPSSMTATVTQPIMLTSTPLTKSAKIPNFEDLMTGIVQTPYTVTAPCTKEIKAETVPQRTLSRNNPQPVTHRLVSHPDSNDSVSVSRRHHKGRINVNCDENSANVNTSAVMEYGFDSSYRNKVIVDEVDRMKLRRKERNYTQNGKYKLRHGLPTPAHNDEGYFDWFENAAQMSPPLATSTLMRSSDQTQNQYEDTNSPVPTLSKQSLDLHLVADDYIISSHDNLTTNLDGFSNGYYENCYCPTPRTRKLTVGKGKDGRDVSHDENTFTHSGNGKLNKKRHKEEICDTQNGRPPSQQQCAVSSRRILNTNLSGEHDGCCLKNDDHVPIRNEPCSIQSKSKSMNDVHNLSGDSRYFLDFMFKKPQAPNGMHTHNSSITMSSPSSTSRFISPDNSQKYLSSPKKTFTNMNCVITSSTNRCVVGRPCQPHPHQLHTQILGDVTHLSTNHNVITNLSNTSSNPDPSTLIHCVQGHENTNAFAPNNFTANSLDISSASNLNPNSYKGSIYHQNQSCSLTNKSWSSDW